MMMPKLIFHSIEGEWIPIKVGRVLYDKSLSPKKPVEIMGPHDSAQTVSRDFYSGKIYEFVN
jgi:hypothetical protein